MLKICIDKVYKTLSCKDKPNDLHSRGHGQRCLTVKAKKLESLKINSKTKRHNYVCGEDI